MAYKLHSHSTYKQEFKPYNHVLIVYSNFLTQFAYL